MPTQHPHLLTMWWKNEGDVPLGRFRAAAQWPPQPCPSPVFAYKNRGAEQKKREERQEDRKEKRKKKEETVKRTKNREKERKEKTEEEEKEIRGRREGKKKQRGIERKKREVE